MTETTEAPARRTKRRYAHELYPHAKEFQTRPLEVEVPYLYARAIGLQTHGTSWIDLREGDELRLSLARTIELVQARLTAFLADALHQGMTGDEAWKWADRAVWDYDGGWTYERAQHYGVDPDLIKPYQCGPEPDHHDHHGEPDARGWRVCTRIDGKESDCPDCTEPIQNDVTEEAS